MKNTVLFTALFLLVSTTTAYACSVDGYVGPNGTSCLYYNYNDGCYYKVTHHRFLFGLFKWNTEEQASCDWASPEQIAEYEG